jgi:hypothetical protein
VRALTLIAGGVLLALLIASPALFLAEWRVGAGVAVLAGAALFWLGRFDKRRQRVERELSAQRDQARIGRLEALATSHDFELKIRGATQAPLTLVLLTAGAALGFKGWADQITGLLAAGASLALVAGFFLLAVIPSIFRPVLVLTRGGFSSPLTGPIAWQHVDGMSLEKIHLRHSVVHRLAFRIRSLAEHMGSFSLFYRILYRLRRGARKQQIHLVLQRTSESPDVVYRVARLLWTQATGRTDAWYPGMPERIEAGIERLEKLDARIRALQSSGKQLPVGDMVQTLNEYESAQRAVLDEAARQLRRARLWLGGMILFFFVVFVGVYYLGR